MGHGSFIGEVVAQWCVEPEAQDREMLLVDDFTYIAPDGKAWLAPKGRVIDGASIPEFLWGQIVGSPYRGNFRRATVVHDIACQDKPFTSDVVHRMFYDAMLCDNTSRRRAKVMYTAVLLFGPQWGVAFSAVEQNRVNISLYLQLIESPEFEELGSPEAIESYLRDARERMIQNQTEGA